MRVNEMYRNELDMRLTDTKLIRRKLAEGTWSADAEDAVVRLFSTARWSDCARLRAWASAFLAKMPTELLNAALNGESAAADGETSLPVRGSSILVSTNGAQQTFEVTASPDVVAAVMRFAMDLLAAGRGESPVA